MRLMVKNKRAAAPAEDLKLERITIRVTEEEKRLIELMAGAQCLTVSSFIRWAILFKYKEDFVKVTY